VALCHRTSSPMGFLVPPFSPGPWQDNRHRQNIFKKLLKSSDPRKKISLSLDINKSLETSLLLVEQDPSKYISLYQSLGFTKMSERN